MEILDQKLFSIGEYTFYIYHLIYLVGILTSAWLISLLLGKAFLQNSRFNKMDRGSRYAMVQIIRYFIWTIAIVLVLETIGIKVSILIAGSAALLVGIGLGLQQTFNDIVSGFILLIEGAIKVGDILDVNGEIVKVKRIGLRTSMVVNRDAIDYFLPNSKIVTDQVINWSHDLKSSRFRIKVGVAYGSDAQLVLRVLSECAGSHPDVLEDKKPFARLIEFGESSLDFEVYFWSLSLFEIERVKADIRLAILAAFNENNIVIPFPQRDLHFKSGMDAGRESRG